MRNAIALAALLCAACNSNTNNNTGQDGGHPGDDGGNPGSGFGAIPMPGDDERVTGVFCSAAHACVVATDSGSDGVGHLYAMNGAALGATLISGDENYAAMFNTVGTVTVIGFSFSNNTLVAHVNSAEEAYVSATGDVSQAANWKSVVITSDGSEFGLNAQNGFATAGGHSTLLSAGRIWDTTDTPGPSATWTNIYSPQAVPPIPDNIEDLRAADPTLCDSDPSVSVLPNLVECVWIAPDRSLIVTPAGTVNQDGHDTPGVCISTDGGKTFHHAEFTGVDQGAGPTGVFCTSKDHCLAFGGIQSTDNSAYIYVSNNASMGASSTWTRATYPALAQDTELHAAAFAPDAQHGWIVGATSDAGPLLFTTSDGGATWSDASSSIVGVAHGNRLHSVYAFDSQHVFFGGEHDTLFGTLGD